MPKTITVGAHTFTFDSEGAITFTRPITDKKPQIPMPRLDVRGRLVSEIESAERSKRAIYQHDKDSFSRSFGYYEGRSDMCNELLTYFDSFDRKDV